MAVLTKIIRTSTYHHLERDLNETLTNMQHDTSFKVKDVKIYPDGNGMGGFIAMILYTVN